jgi:hypothetical protein
MLNRFADIKNFSGAFPPRHLLASRKLGASDTRHVELEIVASLASQGLGQ